MTVPIGTIMAYGGLVDGNARGELQRQGWLVCDGEEHSEDDYPELENTIGTIYGSSRPGMFKVPDLRGRFLRGVDAGAGRDPDAESRNGGDVRTKLGSVQNDTYKSHAHQTIVPPRTVKERDLSKDAIIVGDLSSNRTIRLTEKRGGNETRPKNIALNWIIKAKNV